MTSLHPVEYDERAAAVANASYRWAYIAQAFAILLVIAFRSFVRHQTGWDLFAIIAVGAVVATGYQLTHRTLGRRWLRMTAVAAVCAAAMAVLLATLLLG